MLSFSFFAAGSKLDKALVLGAWLISVATTIFYLPFTKGIERVCKNNFPEAMIKVGNNAYNALVIYNMATTPLGRRGIAVEMSGALTKILPRQCEGNTRGLLYIGKKSCTGYDKNKQQWFDQRAVSAGWGS